MARKMQYPVKSQIPAVIKRNTVLLTIVQALFAGVFQSAMVIAALGIFYFTHSATLGGLASAVAIGGRVLVAYGAGRLMDRVGRKVVLYAGIAVSCSAITLMAYALYSYSVWLFWAGIFLFGTGGGVMNMLRVPVTDMYPASRRGEGMGYLLTGSVVGTFMAPVLSAVAPYLEFVGLGTYVIILLITVPIMISGAVFVKLISPDTKEILSNLKEYYPQESPGVVNAGVGPKGAPLQGAAVSGSIIGAFITSAFSWGGMVMGMSLVSIILQMYGTSLTLINIAVSLHVFGMFGLSIPMGWLADRYGRKVVIALGGFILGAGAFLMPLTSDYAIITLGVFLIGLGWSATNVASTVLICDLTPGPKRGSMLGANDVVTGVTSVALPTLGGAILSSFGFVAFGIAGIAVALPVVLGVLPIKETMPQAGREDDGCPTPVG
jgi:MFS family permease